MLPGYAIDLLIAELLKDLTVVQKLVLGNWSTVVLSPSVATATPLAASENFLHVVETPSTVFENFVLVPEALSPAAAYFVRVDETLLAGFESADPVLEPL